MAESNDITINLLLLGRTQTGKSAAGNTLLGSYDFQSHLSPSSVTTCCSLGRSCRVSGITRRNGCAIALRIRILDTPSYPHSSLSKEQVQHEVRRALALHFREGLHLALLVLRADLPLCPDDNDQTIQFMQERILTKAENDGSKIMQKIYDWDKELLGPTWKDFTAVLLTHADKAEEAGFSEHTYLQSASSTLLSLLSSLQHKYIFLDNQKSITKEERATILRKLLDFVRKNDYQLLLLKHTKG